MYMFGRACVDEPKPAGAEGRRAGERASFSYFFVQKMRFFSQFFTDRRSDVIG